MINLKFWAKRKRQIQIDVVHYEREPHTGKVRTKTSSRWVELGSGLTEGLRVPIDAHGDHGVDVKVTEFKV